MYSIHISRAMQEKKRTVSSSTEKKRKDKIRYWINKIGEQLPPVQNPEKDRVGRVCNSGGGHY